MSKGEFHMTPNPNPNLFLITREINKKLDEMTLHAAPVIGWDQDYEPIGVFNPIDRHYESFVFDALTGLVFCHNQKSKTIRIFIETEFFQLAEAMNLSANVTSGGYLLLRNYEFRRVQAHD
ncbi:hypothetical protein [Photobacterium damselae]|uniref:hypothetical protein n=1 Tax=Photobacterium damselae TaxID=38293 RepID=UPI001F1DCEEC|nr:hypothetical protein [Photobacterium damselae]UKA12915.1 hypothetical protein IHC91_21595 [Photobacterium damselae subsp. damselae]